jgi:hypothetical protein
METALGPPEHEKLCIDVSRPRHARMHYVIFRSHRMQKHKFDVTYPGALFVISIPVPPEHEKYCAVVLHPRCTGMHYVIHRSHRMQKYKFSVTCLNALFVISVLVPPEHEKQ